MFAWQLEAACTGRNDYTMLFCTAPRQLPSVSLCSDRNDIETRLVISQQILTIINPEALKDQSEAERCLLEWRGVSFSPGCSVFSAWAMNSFCTRWCFLSTCTHTHKHIHSGGNEERSRVSEEARSSCP